MSGAIDERDREFLRQAAALAERGRGRTHPNPVVGCVLVRDGRIVSKGYHAAFGGAHAEVNALAAAGDRAQGATAFVSLEPCDHSGKTGPCTVALRDAGISRVVYAAADPGPGKGGAARLREWGIQVDGPGLPEDEARAQNPAFFRVHGEGKPYVAVKLAMSLDARIAGAPGERTPITGPEAAARVAMLRREFDGILIGGETSRTDDPLLTVRDGTAVERPPARIVLDSRLGLSPSARLFSDSAPVHVFCGPAAPDERVRALTEAGAHVHAVPLGPDGLDLDAVVEILWSRGVRAVLCEGGGRLTASLLNAGLVQRFYLFLAPRVLGERGVPAFPSTDGAGSWEGWRPRSPGEAFGSDVLITWDKEEETP